MHMGIQAPAILGLLVSSLLMSEPEIATQDLDVLEFFAGKQAISNVLAVIRRATNGLLTTNVLLPTASACSQSAARTIACDAIP